MSMLRGGAGRRRAPPSNLVLELVRGRRENFSGRARIFNLETRETRRPFYMDARSCMVKALSDLLF